MAKIVTQVLELLFLCLLLVILSGCDGKDSGTGEPSDYVSDVETLCETMSKKYAYFETRKDHWDEACLAASGEAETAQSPGEALGVMEGLIDELYDPHISFNTNSSTSPRLVPSGLNIWFERQGARYVLSGIRAGSSAGEKNLQLGDEFVSLNGLSGEALARTRMKYGLDNVTEPRVNWAFHAGLAGKRGAPRVLVVSREGTQIEVDLGAPEIALTEGTLSSQMLASSIGYIRFHDSLGNGATVEAFDKALEALKDTDALILDLRDTPGGGNTDIAEPIMGRFIGVAQPYQVTAALGKKAVIRKVKPAGDWTYQKPVIVLVGRWTGSMGEGMAIGFDGMARANIMGDHMAGLAGVIYDLRLENAGFTLRYPAYDLTHIDGTPRHLWAPMTPRRADFGSGIDLLLGDAVETIRRSDK